MPRIPGPVEPRGPGGVISQSRPREVRALPTMPALPSPLIELGNAISESGLMVADYLIKQERAAESTRIKAEAERRIGELRTQVETAGTVAEARRLWNERAPRVEADLVQFAEDRGLSEAAPGLRLALAQEQAAVSAFLGKRAAREGLDAVQLYAGNKGRSIVGAASEPEVQRHKFELHSELQRVAETNPLLTPAAADTLFQSTVETAARDRALALLNTASDDPAALAALRDALSDPERFTDLRTDDRGELVKMAIGLEDAVEAREWRRIQHAEVLANRAREQLHLGTLERHSQVLSEGGLVSDSQLLAEVARGEISLPYVRFIQQQRDGQASTATDLSTYSEDRTLAEVGLLDSARVEANLEAGIYGGGPSAIGIARDLIDLSRSAERQGGIFRRADFKAAEDALSFALRGVSRDEPIVVLEEPGDERANEYVLVTSSVRRQVLTMLSQGIPPDQINPFALYGAGLKTIGATRPKPEPSAFPVEEPVMADLPERLREAESVAEIQVIVEALRDRIAERDTQGARDQLTQAKSYLDDFRRWERAQQAAEALLRAVPEERR